MIWCVLFGFFAAVGVLFLLWLSFGAFLPGERGCTLAIQCPKGREKALLRRYRWLRELGMIRCPIILVGSELSSEEQMELIAHFPGVGFQTPEQWLTDTEERQRKHGGAGTGDLTGYHRGGGVSEL